MKKGLLVGMLMVMAVGVYGESFTIAHDFKSMSSPRVSYSGDGKTATTDSVVYHCFNYAKYYLYNSSIHLYMERNNDSIVTSKIEGLKWLQLHYNITPSADRYETISVSISRDGVSWTDVSSSMEHTAGSVTVVIPRRGDYFVKIVNTGTSKPFYIDVCRWHIELCNCFEYIPE